MMTTTMPSRTDLQHLIRAADARIELIRADAKVKGYDPTKKIADIEDRKRDLMDQLAALEGPSRLPYGDDE